MNAGRITMSSKELNRLELIIKLSEKKISRLKVCELLNLSYRQVSNLLTAYKKRGASSLIHGNRGRISNRKYPDSLQAKVIKIISEKYHDFGPTFASEKLSEEEGIIISRETLRKWMKYVYSPQAKGRIENLFKTLQDRLIKELRLANINNINDANKFLENYLVKFNKKFAISARSSVDYHRKVSEDLDLDWTFTLEDNRIIAKDHTVRWKNRLFLIENQDQYLKNRKGLDELQESFAK